MYLQYMDAEKQEFTNLNRQATSLAAYVVGPIKSHQTGMRVAERSERSCKRIPIVRQGVQRIRQCLQGLYRCFVRPGLNSSSSGCVPVLSWKKLMSFQEPIALMEKQQVSTFLSFSQFTWRLSSSRQQQQTIGLWQKQPKLALSLGWNRIASSSR